MTAYDGWVSRVTRLLFLLSLLTDLSTKLRQKLNKCNSFPQISCELLFIFAFVWQILGINWKLTHGLQRFTWELQPGGGGGDGVACGAGIVPKLARALYPEHLNHCGAHCTHWSQILAISSPSYLKQHKRCDRHKARTPTTGSPMFSLWFQLLFLFCWLRPDFQICVQPYGENKWLLLLLLGKVYSQYCL